MREERHGETASRVRVPAPSDSQCRELKNPAPGNQPSRLNASALVRSTPIYGAATKIEHSTEIDAEDVPAGLAVNAQAFLAREVRIFEYRGDSTIAEHPRNSRQTSHQAAAP